jgi:penicillin-binding protein 1C
MRVVSPRDGVTLVRDPTVPANHNTIALQLEVDPAVPEVLWMVDGQPYKLASYPYTVRWQLRAGEHVVQASMPLTRSRSAPVRIRVE